MANEVPEYLAHIKPIDQRLQEELPNIPYAKLYNRGWRDTGGDLNMWYTNGYGEGYAPRYIYDRDGMAIPSGRYTDIWTGNPTNDSNSERIRQGILKSQLENREELKANLIYDQAQSLYDKYKHFIGE